MPQKTLTQRAWELLRLALLGARKGRVFKRRLAMELGLLPQYLKALQHTTQSSALHYGERELSFDDSPIFHIKMHRPASLRLRLPQIPCLKAQVDLDYDFRHEDNEDNDNYYYDRSQKISPKIGAEQTYSNEVYKEMVTCDEEIDLKAEEFIDKFYQQLKLQRQRSYLQYNEMPSS